jgi:hypothetical protein
MLTGHAAGGGYRMDGRDMGAGSGHRSAVAGVVAGGECKVTRASRGPQVGCGQPGSGWRLLSCSSCSEHI